MVKKSLAVLAAMFAVSALAGELTVVDGVAVESHYTIVEYPEQLFERNTVFPDGLDLDRLEIKTSMVSGCKWGVSHERNFAIILYECKAEGLSDDPYYKAEKARAVGVLNTCAEQHDQLSQANYQCIYSGLGIQ